MTVFHDPAAADRSLLDNSQPLPWNRISSAADWTAGLDQLLAALEASQSRQRALKAADRLRLRETLGSMVLGLYVLRKSDTERWGAYSRNNNDYCPSQPYAHVHVSGHTARAAADYLAAAGLAQHHKGFYDRKPNMFGGPGGKGFRSRFRATQALEELLEGSFGLTPKQLQYAHWAPLIRLKAPADRLGGYKRLLPHEHTEETQRMQAELQAINSFLQGFQIDLEAGFNPGTKSADLDDGEPPILPGDTQLYRVFNNGRWDHGGRFYGGGWQALPKAVRSRLLIDGETTVELDFKSLPLRHSSKFPRAANKLLG